MFTCSELNTYKLNIVLKSLTDHTYYVGSLTTFESSDGKTYIISGSYDQTIKIWDVENDYALIKTLTDHTNWVLSLTTFKSSDGKTFIVSGSNDKTIRIWGFENGFAMIKTLTDHTHMLHL